MVSSLTAKPRPRTLADEALEIVLERRLAAGDDHALQFTAARREFAQHPVSGHSGRVAVGVHEFGIVAVGAAEVAPLAEDDGRDPSRVLGQREPLEAADRHRGEAVRIVMEWCQRTARTGSASR